MFQWEDPPSHVSKPGIRDPFTEEVVARLQSKPGEWANLGRHEGSKTRYRASRIGGLEVSIRDVDYSTRIGDVYARWVQ